MHIQYYRNTSQYWHHISPDILHSGLHNFFARASLAVDSEVMGNLLFSCVCFVYQLHTRNCSDSMLTSLSKSRTLALVSLIMILKKCLPIITSVLSYNLISMAKLALLKKYLVFNLYTLLLQRCKKNKLGN